ncbi:hypothetical protein [Brevibacterium aurantiacum]|uniref:hypothetical protein n=1 Tax=Brevibacterium aurantiacum TaxID=273384 RepID=UPI003F931215
MAWLRTGDNVANHPIVLAVLEHHEADDQSVNETFGFIMRCALQSAAHFTDYVISYGTALALAGSKSHADRLLTLATSAGYITPVETDDGKPAFKLIEDTDFIHIRSKEEIDFERQRDRDRKDQGLTVPVWLRDGDACRFCRRIVQWNDKKSQRSGTFDHLIPGQPATHDTYVVACRGCNSALKDLSHEERTHYLLSAPPVPHYSREGIQYWKDTKWFKDNNVAVPKPTTASKLKPGDFIPGATKISTFIQDVQKRNQEKPSDDPQSSTAPVPGSGPKGSAVGSQPTVDPAEPNSSRGPQGTAGSAPVHPARDAGSDGPQGTAGMVPVHPASPPVGDGPRDSLDNQPRVDPASSRPEQENEPADLHKYRSRNDPAIIPQSAEIEGWNIPDTRVGTGRVGPGRAGSGRSGSGLDGLGARQRPARPPEPDRSVTKRKRRRR